jgi:hypothetical protein
VNGSIKEHLHVVIPCGILLADMNDSCLQTGRRRKEAYDCPSEQGQLQTLIECRVKEDNIKSWIFELEFLYEFYLLFSLSRLGWR